MDDTIDLADGACQFGRIFARLPVPLYRLDSGGLILGCNAAAAEFWGRQPLVGRERWCGAWRLFGSNGAGMAPDETPICRAMAAGRAGRTALMHGERPNGGRYAFTACLALLADTAGRPAGAIVMLAEFGDVMPFPIFGGQEDHAGPQGARMMGGKASGTAGNLAALSDREPVALQDVARRALSSCIGAEETRLALASGHETVPAGTGRLLLPALHALATGAVERGVLADEAGSIQLGWAQSREGQMELRWRETGGSSLSAAPYRDYGMDLIESALRFAGGRMEVQALPDGFSCTLDVCLAKDDTDPA